MPPKLAPWRLFFPSALLLAPLNVLAWLALRYGLVDWPVAASAAWHGQEMVFGYTFAVIAGYLLPAMALPVILCLWLLWLAGRLQWLLPASAMEPWLRLAVAAAFPLVLATLGGSRFLAVKRLRNIAFPLIIGLLGVAAVGSYASEAGLLRAPARSAAVLSVYVVALLVMVMGGRAVPTATVGALRARGYEVMLPAHPGIEAATVVGVLVMVILEAAGLPQSAGIVALIVAGILATRMTDWHSSRILHDPEVWPLHLGFFWLALGMALLGLERLALIQPPDAGALHALAAGGIGTVTLVMMVRVTRQRAVRLAASATSLQVLQLLMALAVALRVGGGWLLPEQRALMLWLSAAAWAATFGLGAILLLPAALRSRP